MVFQKALILLDNRDYKNKFVRNKKKTKFTLMFLIKKTVDGRKVLTKHLQTYILYM